MQNLIFYISSRGSSATAWIAKVLSMHPDIVCFHGTRSIPPVGSGTNDMTPDAFMDSLLTCHNSCQKQKIFGAVHGYYGTIAKKAVESRGGIFSHIIRHPIRRIHSQFSDYYGRLFFKESDSEGNINKPEHYYQDIISNSYECVSNRILNDRFILSDVEKLFFELCESIVYSDLTCLRELGAEGNFKMEEITASTESFENFFRFITADKVEMPSSYIDDVFSTKKINTHVKKMDTADIYNVWPDSFKYLYQGVFEKYGGMEVIDIYNGMGYELPPLSRKFDIENNSRIVMGKD